MAEFREHNEQGLQARLAAGEIEAFHLLVDLYHRAVYDVALSYIKIHQSAEDVTQDLFLKLWKNREALADVASLKDYIFILARNAVLDAMRKKGPAFPVGEYLEGMVADPLSSPEDHLQLRQLSSIVNKAVDLLPPQQKRAYHLSREEGMTHDEIAAVMNISKNTVKNHLVAALTFIRQYIANA